MKKILLMIFLIALMGALSGCSSFGKKIDYRKIARDLNEKNMASILNAVDGYAEISQRSFLILSTPEENNSVEKETNDIYLEGVYNTNNNTALGTAIKSFDSGIEKGTEREQIKKEESPEFKISYANNKYTNPNTNETLDLNFIFDKLQGIEKIKPKDYTYDYVAPASVFYDLNEKEFNKVINDDLKITYDKFKSATIMIDLEDGRDDVPKIIEITISLEWEKKDENGKMLEYYLDNSLKFDEDNQKAHQGYEKMRTRGE